MRKIPGLLSIIAVLFSFAAVAVASDIHPRTAHGVTYVSGGVGMDEVAALRGMAKDYNLRLTFAAKCNGDYIAGVNVTVLDAKGNEVLNTVADGPMLFANLAPGVYRVKMDHKGDVLEKRVHITSRRPLAATFAWSNVDFGSAVHCG